MSKSKFPGWRYGPDDQSSIFNSEEEVPEGWVADIAEANKLYASPAVKTSVKVDVATLPGPDKNRADELVVVHSQKELVDILEAMNKFREGTDKPQIEFLASWPKLRLAATILANEEVDAVEELEEAED